MFIGTVMTAACDKPEPQNAAPNPNVDPSVPKVALGAPATAERKEATPPVQGQVDPKEPAQRRDFEQKKY